MNTFRTQAVSAARWSSIAARLSLPALGALALLWGAGLLLAVRRFAIGHAEPLPLPTAFATALAVAIIVIVLRWVMRSPLASHWLATLAPTLVIGTWAVAGSFPGSQWGGWLIWGSAIAMDLVIGQKLTKRFSQTAATSGHPAKAPLTSAPLTSAPLENAAANEEATEASEAHPVGEGETVLQNVLRIRDEVGQEYVYATLRGDFMPGDRAVTLYVGFCPPFQTLPQVEAEVIDGAPAIAKVVQALHNGAQIEVDLDDPSLDPEHVMVEVAAFEVPAELNGPGESATGAN